MRERARRFALSCSKIWHGLCHTVALPFTLKSILRVKKNSGNSIISPCENIIFKESSKGIQDPSRCYNSIMSLNTISLPMKIIFTDVWWKCLERSDGKGPAESRSWSMWRLSSKHVGSRVWAVVSGCVCACIYGTKRTIFSYLLKGTSPPFRYRSWIAGSWRLCQIII